MSVWQISSEALYHTLELDVFCHAASVQLACSTQDATTDSFKLAYTCTKSACIFGKSQKYVCRPIPCYKTGYKTEGQATTQQHHEQSLEATPAKETPYSVTACTAIIISQLQWPDPEEKLSTFNIRRYDEKQWINRLLLCLVISRVRRWPHQRPSPLLRRSRLPGKYGRSNALHAPIPVSWHALCMIT